MTLQKRLVVGLCVALTLPSLASAQRPSLASYRASVEDELERVQIDLDEAKHEVQTLVLSTTPVVRTPQAIVDELVLIEREIFELKLQVQTAEQEIEVGTKQVARKVQEQQKREREAIGAVLARQAETLKAKLAMAENREAQVSKMAENGVVPMSDVQSATQATLAVRNEIQALEARTAAARLEAAQAAASVATAFEREAVVLGGLKTQIAARTARAKALRDIYAKCFTYDQLTSSEIPTLRAQVLELRSKLRSLDRADQPKDDTTSSDQPKDDKASSDQPNDDSVDGDPRYE